MLKKDRLILETLSKRYSKKDMLNELNHKTISNAFTKAKNQSRWQQAKVFGDEIYGRLNKQLDNLKLEPIFRGVDMYDCIHKIFISRDSKYPIAFFNIECAGTEQVNVLLHSSYERDVDEKYLRTVLDKFNAATTNTIKYDEDDSYLCQIPNGEEEDFICGYYFEDKKTAREFAKAMEIINEYFNIDLPTDWHKYYSQGDRRDYGFNSRGEYIRESLKESRQPSIKSQKNRDIKVVVMPIEVLPFFDERLDNLSDDEILEYALNLRHAKIYSAADFNHLWNNDQLDYNPRNSYMRIIRQTK